MEGGQLEELAGATRVGTRSWMSIWLRAEGLQSGLSKGGKPEPGESTAREGVAGRLRERGAPGSSLGRNHDLRTDSVGNTRDNGIISPNPHNDRR